MNSAEFDNDAHFLHETQRGVDPEVLEDIGIKMVEMSQEGSEQSEIATHLPPQQSRPLRQSARARAHNDVASVAATEKPFPWGNADLDSYK